MDNKFKIKKMIYASVFAAMIFVATAFLQISGPTGYVHVGDGLIYYAACLLPFPYSAIAGALGAGLADLYLGYAIWIIPTFIIKFCMSLFFTSKSDKILCFRNYIALAVGGFVNIAGYFISACIIYDWKIALTDIPGNIIQSVIAAAVFILLALTSKIFGERAKLNN